MDEDRGQQTETAAAPDGAEPVGEPLPGQPAGEELEAERGARLDPDNRPDGVEVDNTEREFDAQRAMFTDNPEYEETGEIFPPVEEQDT